LYNNPIHKSTRKQSFAPKHIELIPNYQPPPEETAMHNIIISTGHLQECDNQEGYQDGYKTTDSDNSSALSSALKDLTISFNRVMHLIQQREYLSKHTQCIVHNLTEGHYSDNKDVASRVV